ncbi:MAG: hypothetical protein CL878_01910, partial [Dehalococcoidia bacterium]|nr:hypothetical protein [Dehalococcoidia bacterium]
MSIFAAFALADTIAALVFGNFIFYRNPRATINRVALLLGIVIAAWAFSKFGWRNAESFEAASFWLKVGALWPLAAAVLAHFALVFSEQTKLLRR